MIITSWNICGLNNMDKRTLLKSSLQSWKPQIICLQETKIKEQRCNRAYTSILPSMRYHVVEKYAEGASGGIATCLDSARYKLLKVTVGKWSLATELHDNIWNMSWLLVNNMDRVN